MASLMAVVSGLVCILIGLLRLGFVTELLSKPIRYGYMNGIAFTVLVSQLPKLFGILDRCRRPAARAWWRSCEAVLGGRANWTAFAVGAGTLALITAAQAVQADPGPADRGRRRDAGGRAGSASMPTAGVKVLGPLPQGLPSFALPWIGFDVTRARS